MKLPPLDDHFPDMSQKFYAELNDLLLQTKEGYINCIIHYCETTNTEPELVATYITTNPALKAKIHAECEELRLVKKVRRLPI